MSRLADFTRSVQFNHLVSVLAENRNIDFDSARKIVSEMSFMEYHKLIEDIVPPSGQTIGPQANATTSQAAPSSATSNVKSIWPGKGAPVQQGMTVGLKGPNGLPLPGQVTQVDQGAKGAKIKDPTTGQEEWYNNNDLQPFVASGGLPTADQQNQGTQAIQSPQQVTELKRLRELAGMKENCSGGATGAGAIAIAPAAMGNAKKRQVTDEELKKEYHRTEAPKTVVGDTKPGQASGELSANLAASGMKSAGRANNGMKRR